MDQPCVYGELLSIPCLVVVDLLVRTQVRPMLNAVDDHNNKEGVGKCVRCQPNPADVEAALCRAADPVSRAGLSKSEAVRPCIVW
jgi:hypothetical protein